MKKKILLALVLAGVLCIVGCGNGDVETGGKNTETENSMSSESQLTEESESNDVNDSQSENSESEVVELDESQIAESIQNMLPPMDSIMLCATENGIEYNAENPDTFWTLMYYLVVNHGYGNPLAEFAGGDLKIGSRAVFEYAAAMFEIEKMPDIPASRAEIIKYDEKEDAYYFMLSDRGLSDSEIVSFEKNADGSYDVIARLYDVEEGGTISTAKFHLVKNKNIDGIDNPQFYWTITSAEEVK